MAETFTVLVVDQFSNITPYSLQKHPRIFDDLVKEIIATPHHFLTKPRLLEVSEDWTPPYIGLTSIRADKDGRAEVWKCRWDSSG